ncbi:MAG TPA: hypothetical protein VMU85_20860 [Stellaceae bacterium]|nr:hypothetical protein [Stellaceae bacterium]
MITLGHIKHVPHDDLFATPGHKPETTPHAIARRAVSVLALVLFPVFLGLIGLGSVALSRLHSPSSAIEISELAPLPLPAGGR